MADATNLRGVNDVRTALSARLRAAPAQKGTVHRGLYLLGTEKQRLEKEITRLERQQRRVEQRLKETLEAIAKMQEKTQAEIQGSETAPDAGARNKRAAAPKRTGQWSTMPVEY